MPTTKAHFEAIGRVAYEWSRLELFAQTLIAALANIPQDRALIITNSGSIKAWMETIRRLAAFAQCPADLLARCKKLTEEIETKLYPERNTVIHGLWDMSWPELFGDHFQPPPDLAARVVGVKKFGRNMLLERDMTAAEVEAIAQRIYGALCELESLAVALIDASRHKPP